MKRFAPVFVFLTLALPASNSQAEVIIETVPVGNPGYATEVGEFENSASPYGTFDQGGNVCEWNETAVAVSSRGVRGGYWSPPSYSDHLHVSYRRTYYFPSLENRAYGFRVACAPEPGSITLFTCGVVAGLIRWRRWR